MNIAWNRYGGIGTIPCILPRVNGGSRAFGPCSWPLTIHRGLRSKQHGVVVHRTPPGVTHSLLNACTIRLESYATQLFPIVFPGLAWARQVYGAYQRTYCIERKVLTSLSTLSVEGKAIISRMNVVFRVLSDSILHGKWFAALILSAKLCLIAACLAMSNVAPPVAATAIHLSSSALAKELKSRWNLKKITIFPQSFATDNFTMTSGKWLDLYRTDRISKKGVTYFNEAYARLCQSQTPPMLRIIGMPYGENCLMEVEYSGLHCPAYRSGRVRP